MAKLSAHSTYVRIVGEVAIAWNRLERRLDSLIFHYFTVDAHVAGFVLGEMRNATKAEFAKFLIERFEENPLLREHGLYFANLVNRPRRRRSRSREAPPVEFHLPQTPRMPSGNQRQLHEQVMAAICANDRVRYPLPALDRVVAVWELKARRRLGNSAGHDAVRHDTLEHGGPGTR